MPSRTNPSDETQIVVGHGYMEERPSPREQAQELRGFYAAESRRRKRLARVWSYIFVGLVIILIFWFSWKW
jgi:hypothetical protein